MGCQWANGWWGDNGRLDGREGEDGLGGDLGSEDDMPSLNNVSVGVDAIRVDSTCTRIWATRTKEVRMDWMKSKRV